METERTPLILKRPQLCVHLLRVCLLFCNKFSTKAEKQLNLGYLLKTANFTFHLLHNLFSAHYEFRPPFLYLLFIYTMVTKTQTRVHTHLCASSRAVNVQSSRTWAASVAETRLH